LFPSRQLIACSNACAIPVAASPHLPTRDSDSGNWNKWGEESDEETRITGMQGTALALQRFAS